MGDYKPKHLSPGSSSIDDQTEVFSQLGSMDELDPHRNSLDPRIYPEDRCTDNTGELGSISTGAQAYATEDLSIEELGPNKERSRRRIVFETLFSLIFALIAALLIRTFVLEVYEVPSGSMIQTIQIGDRLIAEKVSLHFVEPQVGSVVTFADPEKPGIVLVKRLIAKAGDTIDFKDGKLVINGVVQNEAYVEGKTMPLSIFSSTLREPVVYPFVVPDGYVWMMGDNRENSLDSRYFGPIPVSSLQARVLVTVWPLNHLRTF